MKPSLDQRAPLHMAAEGGHVEIVRYLVEKKADIRIQEMTGVSV